MWAPVATSAVMTPWDVSWTIMLIMRVPSPVCWTPVPRRGGAVGVEVTRVGSELKISKPQYQV